jgi:hypothetical protein
MQYRDELRRIALAEAPVCIQYLREPCRHPPKSLRARPAEPLNVSEPCRDCHQIDTAERRSCGRVSRR